MPLIDSFLKTRNGRQSALFGEASDHMELGLLDDDEFHSALNVLHDLRIDFM
jgi:hypothetical protein